jgi:serine/threonine-protein kinase RsbW
MTEIPNVRLRLTNGPENVLLVRQALSGVAEAIDLDPLELNDLNTAVSEACNNVVVHAYGDGEGPLEVDICARPQTLGVVVRDRGVGIGSAAALKDDPSGNGVEQTVGGIGLPVIRALAQDAEFKDLAGGGTEVRMEFATSRAGVLARPLRPVEAPARDDAAKPDAVSAGDDALRAPALPAEGLASTMALTVAPQALARTVLPRLLCALAARAHFSTDRISDTQLLADALVAQTDGALSASHLGVAIGVAPRKLELRVGPLRSGHASALMLDSPVDGRGGVLERLSDGHEVTAAGSGEILQLRMAAGS